MKTVVILVDNKRRDLPGAALIAHHLQKIGVRCELEPLGAWRSVLWAHKPDMIIFNHLTAPHLEKYSQELHQMGILTAVIPNEGILYDPAILEFNASKAHNKSHIDYFFCWNKQHAKAVEKVLSGKPTRACVIGIPRFDFYFPPLAKTFPSQQKKKILFCTNFVFSKFLNCDRSVAERFFGRWSDAVPDYKKWGEFVQVNHNCRIKFFDFLNAAVQHTEHEIILRPHPNEDTLPYEKWYSSLNSDLKKRVRYERNTPVADLILECDIEIACDTCTTSLESWIASKPTIELNLTNHPIFHHEFIAKLSTLCDNPDHLPAQINDLLKNGEPHTFKSSREAHLKKWCNTPDGHVCERFADLLNSILKKHSSPNLSKLSSNYIRRGLRLKLLKKLNLPCTYKPFLSIKHALQPGKYARKYQGYEKTIRPSEVSEWLKKFRDAGV